MDQTDAEIRDIIDREIDGIRNIPIDNTIHQAIELIYQYAHQKGGKVIVSGIGKAGQIGHNIATTFSSTGTPAVFLHPSEAQHGDLGIIQQNDILFLISNSGKTREILELIPLTKKLFPDIKSIALTGHPENDRNTSRCLPWNRISAGSLSSRPNAHDKHYCDDCAWGCDRRHDDESDWFYKSRLRIAPS